ncbi:MAG TPA: DUF433 domain-containing protein [Allosphingosinicella sp.]|jgi:uncharacterized protein (DUF433 family)
MTKALDRTPWDGIIVTDADTCFGKARIAGTRIYVDFILQAIEGGWSIDDFVREYPHVTRAQVQAVIGFARDLVAAKRNRLKGEQRRAAPAEEIEQA